MELNCRFLSLFFGGLIFLGLHGTAQDRKLISGDFNGLTFDQFVHEVEAKTDYHFYFNPSQFDSLSISLKADNKPLSLILDEIFLNTQFHYGIDAENHVF